MHLKLTLAILATTCLAPAAAITWSNGPSFAGANGHLTIATNGTLVHALNFGGNNVVANGIQFTGTNIGLDFNASEAGSTTDTGFNSVVNSFSWVFGPASLTRTLSGLTIGNTYQLQIFMADARSCCSNRTNTLADPLSNSIQYRQGDLYSVFGNFTADSTSQTYTIFGSESPIINGEVLRNTTPTNNSAVPEPTSLLLSAGALALLVHRARR